MSCHGPSRHPPVIWKCLFSHIGNHASRNVILVSQKMLSHAPNLSEPLLVPPSTRLRLGTTKVLWRICPKASDPPVVGDIAVVVVVISEVMACGRVADMPAEKLKGGDENFLRLPGRSTAGCRDVYSSFNHTLVLWRGSTASLEDMRALYHVANPPEVGAASRRLTGSVNAAGCLKGRG